MKSINKLLFQFFLVITCLSMSIVKANSLQVSSKTFSILPVKGMVAAHTRSGVLVDEVYTDVKTNLLLLKDGNTELLFVTSTLGIEYGTYRENIIKIVKEYLDLTDNAIITAASHNHCVPLLLFNDEPTDKKSPQYLSWKIGQDFIAGLRASLKDLKKTLQPVQVYYGKAEENRISYNRRGVYTNGKTYFMREEDRQLVGDGYRGLIDPDVSLAVFKHATTDKPVAAMMMFGCHPVVAYNPEKQFVHGQFPQIATEELSKELGNIPVAFLQGTSGDINAKYMLTGTIDRVNEAGKMLSETAKIALKNLVKSKRDGLEWTKEMAYIPYDRLPARETIERDLQEIDDFIKRGQAGDENTLQCVGMNFPRALTPAYRANLITGVRNWYVWALKKYENNDQYDLPSHLEMPIVVVRFGDVGYVGMPYEAFVKTGLKIKHNTNLPMVMPGGYTNGAMGYIPDASATSDREYMSGYFRYRGNVPPYKAPAADAAADVAIDILNKYAK